MTTMQANKRIALKNILFLTDFSESSATAIPLQRALPVPMARWCMLFTSCSLRRTPT